MPTDTKPIDPTTRRRKLLSWNLAMITAISFSLTFAGVGVALLAGVLPQRFASLPLPVDMGVVLLIVPLCALTFAMVAEVLRAALRGALPRRPRRTASSLIDASIGEWRPGHGEG